MKRVIAFAAALLVLSASAVQAAPTVLVTPGVSLGGNPLLTFSVDPNGSTYDTLEMTFAAGPSTTFKITPGGLQKFTPNSDVTAFAAYDYNDNYGFNVLGGTRTTTNLFGIMVDDTSGSNISEVGVMTVAELVRAVGSTAFNVNYTLRFADNGFQVAEVIGSYPAAVPEASAFAMLLPIAIGGIGVLRVKRGWATRSRRPSSPTENLASQPST